MTWQANDTKEDTSALIPWKGTEANRPADTKKPESKGFFQFLVRCWYAVKGFTASDIVRLKEAGVRQVEAKAEKDIAEAREKLANAAKAHAEAEKVRAETRAIVSKTDCDRLEAQVAAAERFEAILSKIRQNGGDVAFDSKELAKRIVEIGKSHNDAHLLETARDIEDQDKK